MSIEGFMLDKDLFIKATIKYLDNLEEKEVSR